MVPFVAPVTYRPRNTHIFSGKGDYLGGAFINSPSQIRQDDIYSMCDKFLVFPGRPNTNFRWSLHVLDDKNQFGDLEPATCRAPSTGAALDDDSDGSGSAKGMPTNQTRFRNGVVKNDNQACTITGYQEGAGDPIAAAHIFPVSKLKLWNDEGYARWITDTNNPKTIGPSKLFSRQNGIALAPTIHGLWDRSLFSVNPDRDYKSVWFIEDRNNLPGRTLAPSTRNCNDPNNRVSDECLRWHFHQAVLTNMRGAGERPWDLKPDEEDEIELMMDKENADEILEEVLANRLGPFIKQDNEEDGDDDDDHDGYHNYYGYYDDHDRDAQ